MNLTVRVVGMVTAAVLLAIGAGPAARAQGQRGTTSIALGVGDSRAVADALDARIATMLASGELVRYSVETENNGARVHEYFAQMHQGVRVFGGGVSRQRVGDLTTSAFGTIYEGIDVPARPRLASAVALLGPTESPLAALAPGSDVSLLVLPALDGSYRLTYRATYSDGQVRFVDADAGAVVRAEDAFSTQNAVGTGTGVQGDTKKVAAFRLSDTYETRDQLRPGNITTRSTQGTPATQTQLINGAGNVGSDSDNVWVNPALVDAHVNAGWTTDYFFKRHGWNGVDGNNSPHLQVVADFVTLPNNAFFAYPTSSTSGTGLAAYGVTSRGVPMTPLDVVGHELMHGVTFFSLRRRTGLGLTSSVILDGVGPTVATENGVSYPCSTTVLNLGGGVQAPYFCQNGQYVLASSHGGALNEGFSDVFGTAAEFFHEPAGSGPLRADYTVGEDTAVPGGTTTLLRSLSNPVSQLITTGLAYPDHFDRRLRYTVVNLNGSLLVMDEVILDGRFIPVSTDSGGVHFNSTIIGHAYYLAIEGGVNRVSGRTVTGVGQANREQIERVFFRAMTVLTPQQTTFPIMASALRQAAVDLYGTGHAAFRAVDQALSAIGL